jgi:hypothetical protein
MNRFFNFYMFLVFFSCKENKNQESEIKTNGIKTELYIGDSLLKIDDLTEIISKKFEGFTIIRNNGYWKYNKMSGFTVIIFHKGNKSDEEKIKEMIENIKTNFNHKSILRADFSCSYNF